MKEVIKKYYPFWVGLFLFITLIGKVSQYNKGWSLLVISAYVFGYFRLTDLN